jgi:hypothetical protein
MVAGGHLVGYTMYLIPLQNSQQGFLEFNKNSFLYWGYTVEGYLLFIGYRIVRLYRHYMLLCLREGPHQAGVVPSQGSLIKVFNPENRPLYYLFSSQYGIPFVTYLYALEPFSASNFSLG